MEFRDLKKQYKALKTEIDKGIAEVIESTSFIHGKQVDQLEKELAEYVGVKHCISCANGTEALSLALMAWDIKEGDCVFVPDLTFFASGEAVAFVGATPVFVDVDARTFNMDAVKLEKAIQKVLAEGKWSPKAVIAVDLYGLPADFDAIRPVADKYGLKLLEDGAQGFGGEINGKRSCSFGDISTTSFFPAKPLGCYGDGGAIFTNDDEANSYLRSVCVHGKGSYKYDNVRIGCNSRLDTIQAAVLLPKLHAFIEYERDDINQVAAWYTEGLKELEGEFVLPSFPDKFVSSWAQYTLIMKTEEERDALRKHLEGKGIPTMVYYPNPMHEQKAFAHLAFDQDDFVVTNRLCRTVISLPMSPYLDKEEIETVVGAVKEFYSK